MNNILFGNDQFGYYETVAGGVGAGPGFHGQNAVHQHMTNTRITDPEILEFRYPAQIERFEIRKGSGGPGNWKGGDGIIREILFRAELDLTIVSQHRIEKPYGLSGGSPGKVGRQTVIRKNGQLITLSGIDSCTVYPGDRLVIETPGGGGYGEE